MHFLCEHILFITVLIAFLLSVFLTSPVVDLLQGKFNKSRDIPLLFISVILIVPFIFLLHLLNSDTYIKEVGTTYSGTVIDKVNEENTYKVTLKDKDGDKTILRIIKEDYRNVHLNEKVSIVKVENMDGIQIK